MPELGHVFNPESNYMNPLTAATTFAQIVSLLADYAASRGGKDVLDIRDLAEWTATHGHADVMRAIEQNQATTVSVKAALTEGRDELLGKLAALDEKISAVAAGLGPLDDLARSLRPNSVLSEQARDILRKFERTQATSAIENHSMDVPSSELFFLDARSEGSLIIAEPRFYDFDIDQLVRMGLLLQERNKSGERVFKLSRPGSMIAQQLLAAQQ